jgi:hypothetical protein
MNLYSPTQLLDLRTILSLRNPRILLNYSFSFLILLVALLYQTVILLVTLFAMLDDSITSSTGRRNLAHSEELLHDTMADAQSLANALVDEESVLLPLAIKSAALSVSSATARLFDVAYEDLSPNIDPIGLSTAFDAVDAASEFVDAAANLEPGLDAEPVIKQAKRKLGARKRTPAKPAKSKTRTTRKKTDAQTQTPEASGHLDHPEASRVLE